MPESPRVRHVQHHAQPVGSSPKQPGAGLNRNPRSKKRAQALGTA